MRKLNGGETAELAGMLIMYILKSDRAAVKSFQKCMPCHSDPLIEPSDMKTNTSLAALLCGKGEYRNSLRGGNRFK